MIGDAKVKLNRGHRAFQQPNLTDCVIYLYERRPALGLGEIPIRLIRRRTLGA